jgi:hypothetical protein
VAEHAIALAGGDDGPGTWRGPFDPIGENVRQMIREATDARNRLTDPWLAQRAGPEGRVDCLDDGRLVLAQCRRRAAEATDLGDPALERSGGSPIRSVSRKLSPRHRQALGRRCSRPSVAAAVARGRPLASPQPLVAPRRRYENQGTITVLPSGADPFCSVKKAGAWGSEMRLIGGTTIWPVASAWPTRSSSSAED